MPNINKILKKVKKQYDSICDQMLESDVIGSNVKLFYPPTFENCVNCEFASFGSPKTIYRAGGPAPFTLGGCPMCGGSCKKEVEHTEVVRLRLYSSDSKGFDRRFFKQLGINIDVPEGNILSIGYLADLTKIKSANYAQLYTDQNEYHDWRYKLSSEPAPHGLGRDKYFYCFWSRV